VVDSIIGTGCNSRMVVVTRPPGFLRTGGLPYWGGTPAHIPITSIPPLLVVRTLRTYPSVTCPLDLFRLT